MSPVKDESAIFSETAKEVTESIAANRWSVVKSFIPLNEIRDLASDAQEKQKRGEFSAAAIGQHAERVIRPDIRGDQIQWWDDARLTPAQERVMRRFHELKRLLNQEFFLGLRSIEAHYTYYPAGTFYARHLDRFKDTDSRILSCILYLNEEWRDEDGGQLVIYPRSESGVEEMISVLPEGGTLASFLCEDMPHEVKVNHRGRWAVVAWLGRKDLLK